MHRLIDTVLKRKGFGKVSAAALDSDDDNA